jgi:1-acyl-sn-glycerol-3-phosphate acyltransferase
MFAIFVLWCVFQVLPSFTIAFFWRRFGVCQFRVFTLVIAKLFGIRFSPHGGPSGRRPLLLVSNHISIFELIAFSAFFGATFFAKGEIKRMFPVNLFVKNFGNAFIDRRPAKARQAVGMIVRMMKSAKNPFAIFPEGTTDNGSHILPFKSAMFDFVEQVPGVVIQPVVIFYRDRFGNKIPPQVLADEYAYISNARQIGPPYAKKELSVVGLLWRTLMRGGFVFEAHTLPVFETAGLDRKQIAAELHEIVDEKFQELK